MHIKTNLWGKKKEKDGQYYWLPLEQHLLDTGNIMIQLWNHWLSEGQRKFIMESISESEVEAGVSLASFLGLVHDLGKSTPAFALKPSFNNQSPDLDKILTENLIKSGFSGLENWSTESSSKSPHALASQVLLEAYGVREDIASIVGGHHGRTANDKQEIRVQLATYTANYCQYDHDGECAENWREVQRKLFEWALEGAGYRNVAELPEIKRPAQVLLQGLLIMADWIASNEEYFPLFPIDKEEEAFQEERLESGWERWSKTYLWTPNYFHDIDEQYNKRFQFRPRQIQRAFSEVIDKVQNPGIIILEAPMGVGKTEAALLGVEQMAEKGKCSGMFFGLPTQATSDGIFSRIKDWVGKIAGETSDNKSLQLVHGKAQFNETFQNLKNAENIYADEGSVVINEWFTGRKTAILDDFVVGTVDQLLLAGLKQKHLALRHLGLSKKVIVIDEVHAYDAYMGEFLYRVVEWLGAYRVPIIILSATLPASRRTRLVETYCRGMGMKKRNIKAAFTDWKETEAYPLITYTDGDWVGQMRDFPLENTKEVKVELLEEDDLAATLQRELSNGGIAGIIVNTVKRAQKIAEKLEVVFVQENISVLHSGFLAPHRREKEAQLLDEIGKNAKRPQLRIVIGTQVLEQSLDIDFDVLFTDIAPMDLLLQRIGRLHRHRETERPGNLKNPVVYIMGIQAMAEFEEGTRKIYGDYLLIRTQLALPGNLALPADISKLVQQVYKEQESSEVELEVPVSIIEKYKEAKAKDELKIKEKEKNSNVFRLKGPYDLEENSLIGWLKDDIPSDTEEAGLAKVRDGSESIEVILVKRKENELYLLDDITSISGELTPALAKKISQQTIRLPHIFCFETDKIIKELEMRNYAELSRWQDEPWLEGSLGIVLDEHNSAELIGYKLHYDIQYGLMVGKEEG